MPDQKIKRTRSLPYNFEAEQAILGCILFDADLGGDLLADLAEEDFHSKANRLVFAGMKRLFLENQPVDLVTLLDTLDKAGVVEEVGGVSYLTELENGVVSTSNYRHYYDIVKRDSVMRKLIRASRDIADICLSDATLQQAVAIAEKSVFDVSAQFDSSSVVPLVDPLVTVLDQFQSATMKKGNNNIPTGFAALDRMLNGLHPTDLVLVAARPGMGKTALALNIVANAAIKANATCLVFSLEMGKEQLAQRLLCSQAKVSMEKALKGELAKDDWIRIWAANNKLKDSKIFIDESTLITPAEMISKCRRIKARHGLDLVMVDYIQLMQSGKRSDSRQQEVSEISRMLKILAKELKVPVVALSQLSRDIEKRTDKRPQLSDLRESGAIEQDADIIIFINRPEDQKGEKLDDGTVQRDIADITVAKHRNGPTGVLKLLWMGEYTLFQNNDVVADKQAEAYGIAQSADNDLPPPPSEIAELPVVKPQAVKEETPQTATESVAPMPPKPTKKPPVPLPKAQEVFSGADEHTPAPSDVDAPPEDPIGELPW